MNTCVPVFQKEIKSCLSDSLQRHCSWAPPPVWGTSALEGGALGVGATPSSHSAVRAGDSLDTRSHLSAVYTFGLDLWAGGDRLSRSKKESKQTRAGEVEGRMDKWRERNEARTFCVNAGRDCKASPAMTAKCANFLPDHAQWGGPTTELWKPQTLFLSVSGFQMHAGSVDASMLSQ